MKALDHVDRYREVAAVLVRHGLGSFAAGLGLDRWLPSRQRASADTDSPGSRAAHLRVALEELGPAFIKLGQLLSTGPDLLPPEYAAELSKLQDTAPPVPIGAIIAAVREELGAAPDDVFASFDPVPLAAGSIGQVHAATLSDGTAVVVKVRRPGVVDQVNRDLEILQNLALYARRHWRAAQDYNLEGITAQFARSMRAELDYLEEGRNADRFRETFRGSASVHIPLVFWDTSSSRVLTLERITGVKVDDVPGLHRAGIDPADIIRRAVDVIARMVFEAGFFHADPHPGNLLIEQDGRIGLIDFGLVGTISEQTRDRLTALFLALSRADPDRIAAALTRLCSTRRSVDRDELRVDLAGFVTLYQGRALGEVDVARLLGQVLTILRRHRLQLQTEIALLARMLLIVEGLGTRLDPTFNLGETLRPYAARLAANRYSPTVLAERAARAGMEAAALSVELPDKIRKLVDLLDTHGVEVHLRAAEIDPLLARAERIGNRLVAGMITAAVIVTVGQVLAVSASPTVPSRRPAVLVPLACGWLAGHRTGR